MYQHKTALVVNDIFTQAFGEEKDEFKGVFKITIKKTEEKTNEGEAFNQGFEKDFIAVVELKDKDRYTELTDSIINTEKFKKNNPSIKNLQNRNLYSFLHCNLKLQLGCL